MCIFLDSWPPQIRAYFDGYHFFTICRRIYWAEEYLFDFEPFDKVKKKIKHKKFKRTKRKKSDDAGGRASDLRFIGDRMKPERLGKLPYIWRQTGMSLTHVHLVRSVGISSFLCSQGLSDYDSNHKLKMYVCGPIHICPGPSI